MLQRAPSRWTVLVLCAGILLSATAPARAEVVTLLYGLQLKGRISKQPSVLTDPLGTVRPEEAVDVSKIVIVDDGLRRVFVSSNLIRNDGIAPEASAPLERIILDKPIADTFGRRIVGVGPIVDFTPWDEFGNRILTMQTDQGLVPVIQGMKEITPYYIRVEGLQVDNPYILDMRIATSTVPRELLTRIMMQAIPEDQPRERLRIVTLYIQAERYRDALQELEQIMSEFPELSDLPAQRQRLLQLVAGDAIREIERRQEAGQHARAYALLDSFPETDVAGELLLEVSDLLDEYHRIQDQGERVLALFEEHTEALASHDRFDQIESIVAEMREQLTIHTLDRMADYLRLSEDDSLNADQKLALAISGWLLGTGAGTENMAEALSLVGVRNGVRAYLASDKQLEREQVLEQLQTIEGFAPDNVARIVRHMLPPVEVEPQDTGIPGYFEFSLPGLGDEPEFRYYIQLPEEYHPYRQYPCVVTLHGSGTTAPGQVDWWAGGYDPERQVRMGQASRRGYFVIAPVWARENQREYEYSVREHAAVLFSLRHACKRFSIDTDRVYLSGHSIGGDAAWDIGLAHPDLWAGVMPIVATADKYVARYWENGRGLPMYFVGGELDGSRLASNARDFDRYFQYAHFDVLYAEYIGRGHEHFYEEIQNLFDWMNLHERDFYPREIECVTMRPWDNFFWWVEVDGLPSASIVHPVSWPGRRARPALINAEILATNGLRVRSPAARTTVWMSPEMINFDRRIEVNGRRVDVLPSAEVILEDVRRRGDRLHPYWAKYEINTGRRR